jgi:protein-S-isoprenylcysteine O-methyltransferase Ste14
MISWSRVARRIRVPTGFVITVVYFWLARPTAKSLVFGAVISAVGLAVRTIASGHVQKNEQLTMSGPYAYLRNPLYFGSTVLAAGLTVAARSWWVAVYLIVMFLVIYLPVIWSEEAFLRATFPEFEEYSRHVPRLVPRFTAFGNAKGRFSWALYWKHREYNAVLGSVFMLLVLTAKLIWWST